MRWNDTVRPWANVTVWTSWMTHLHTARIVLSGARLSRLCESWCSRSWSQWSQDCWDCAWSCTQCSVAFLYHKMFVNFRCRMYCIYRSWNTASICSLSPAVIIAHSWVFFKKKSRQTQPWRQSVHKISSCILPLLWFLPLLCCHDPFIVRSAKLITQLCTSVSTFTISPDNCLFLCNKFPCIVLLWSVLVSLGLQLVTRSIIGSSQSSCSGVWDPWSAECQSCKFAMLLEYWSRDWRRSNICTIFAVGKNLLDTELSVLYAFLYTQKIVYQLCFVRGLAPNQSVKELVVELPLGILQFSFECPGPYVKKSQGNSNLTTPLLSRSRLSCSAVIQISQLCFLSAPPIREIAVHQDCDRVNMFLSSKSQRCFGLSHQISRCTFQRDKVEFTRFTQSLDQVLRGFCKV